MLSIRDIIFLLKTVGVLAAKSPYAFPVLLGYHCHSRTFLTQVSAKSALNISPTTNKAFAKVWNHRETFYITLPSLQVGRRGSETLLDVES